MTAEPRNFFGMTPSEVIKSIPDELPCDAIGLWQIDKHARAFGLEGAAFNEFFRQSIVAIVSAGGIPVRGAIGQPGKFWEPQYCFGNTPAAIADNVFIQWLSNKQEADMGGLWFATEEHW